VTAKKNIARLQRQLDEARLQIKNGGNGGAMNTSNISKTTPLGVELIDNTL
jgi:predicted nuclease with TOPRIM domain